jgi:hypothetical protein
MVVGLRDCATTPICGSGTADGMLHAVRKWEAVTDDLETLAQEIAQLATGGEVETGAVVLVRREAG